MFISVIIAAAGLSKRMGKNKQFIEIDDIPVLAKTISVFENLSYIDEIIIAINENDILKCKTEIIEKFKFKKIKHIIKGGKERQDSIDNSKKYISKNSDLILVHDGARCFITKKVIENVIYALKDHEAVIPVVNCKDTIKICENNIVIDTPDRKKLYAVQTPQGFHKDVFLKIYENAYKNNFYGTDDSSLAEKMNIKVYTVEGDYLNIKITTPSDLSLIK